jgi:hypothetical protein
LKIEYSSALAARLLPPALPPREEQVCVGCHGILRQFAALSIVKRET